MPVQIDRYTELVPSYQAPRDQVALKFVDIDAAKSWVGQFRPDGLSMHKLRAALSLLGHGAGNLTDSEVLDQCAWKLADGRLLLKYAGAFPPARTTPVGKPKVSLQRACDEAYDETSDSGHAVWEVLKALVNADEPYREPHVLVDRLQKLAAGGSVRWREVTLDEAWALANGGILVIGGAIEAGEGHVLVVYPGDKKSDGGFRYREKDRDGVERIVNRLRTGSYPRSMSRSTKPSPGGNSRGDRTVRDAFSKEVFPRVKFWAYQDRALP